MRRISLLTIVATLVLSLVLTNCAGFFSGVKLKFELDQKLATAKEGGYQLVARTLPLIKDDAQRAEIAGILEKRLGELKADLSDPEKIIDVSYFKERFFDWIEEMLNKYAPEMKEEDVRAIKAAQYLFDFEGGRDATPEERGIGVAFIDGASEALAKF